MANATLRYAQVLDEYNQWKSLNPDTELTLPEFALNQDTREGGDFRRQAAYNDNTLKRISAVADQLLSPVSGITASAGRQLGEQIGDFVGREDFADIGEDVGRATPRMAIEFLPWTAATKIPRAAQLLTKGAGMASAALSSYTETDSPAAAAVTAAAMPLIPRFGSAGERVAQRIMLRPTEKAIEAAGTEALKAVPRISGVGAKVGEEIGREAGFLVHGAVQQNATSLATGQGLSNPLDPAELFANILGNVAFAPLSVRGLMHKPMVNGVEVPSQTHYRQAQMVAEHQRPIADRIIREQQQAADDAARQQIEGSWTEEMARVNDIQRDYDLDYEMYGQSLDENGNPMTKRSGVISSPARESMMVLRPTIEQRPLGPRFDVQIVDRRTPEQRAEDRQLGRGDQRSGIQIVQPFDFAATREQASTASAGVRYQNPLRLSAEAKRAFEVKAGLDKPGEVKLPEELPPSETPPATLAEGIKSLKDVVATLKSTLPPDVIRAYTKRGFLPEINEQWIQTEFKSQLDESLTGSFDEAYGNFQTALQNRYDRLLQDAKTAATRAAELPTGPDSSAGIQQQFFTLLDSAPTSLKNSVGRAWQLAAEVRVGRGKTVDYSDGFAKRLMPMLEAGKFNAAESWIRKFVAADLSGRRAMVGGGKGSAKQTGRLKDQEQSFEALTEVQEKGFAEAPVSATESRAQTTSDALSLLDDAELNTIADGVLGSTHQKDKKLSMMRDLLIAYTTNDVGTRRAVAAEYAGLPVEKVSPAKALQIIRNAFGSSANQKANYEAIMKQAVGRAVELGGVAPEDTAARSLDIAERTRTTRVQDAETQSPELEAASLKENYANALESIGYSKPVAAEFSELALRIHQSFELGAETSSVRRLSKDSPYGGLAVIPAYGRGVDQVFRLIGIDLRTKPDFGPGDWLITLGHEQYHVIDKLAGRLSASGDLSKLTGREQAVLAAHESMVRYSDSLTPQQRKQVIASLYSIITPDNQRAAAREFAEGTAFETADEFLAEYTGILVAGAVSDKSTRVRMFNDLKWLPIEERNYANGILRNLMDAGRVISEVHKLNYKTPLDERFQQFQSDVKTLIRDSKVVDDAVMQLNDLMAHLSPEAVAAISYDPSREIQVEAADYDGAPSTLIKARQRAAAKQRAQEAVDRATDQIFGDPVSRATKMNRWERWFAPFSLYAKSAAKKGMGIAEDAKVIIFGTQPGFARNTQYILEPILTRGQLGKSNFDTGGPLLSAAANKDPAKRERNRLAISKIAKRMQERKAGFEDPEVQKVMAAELRGFSDDDRAQVLGGMRQMLQMYQRAGSLLVRSKYNEMALRAARLMQFKAPEVDHKQLVAVADKLVQAANDPAQMQAVQAELAATGINGDALNVAINHIADSLPLLKQLEADFTNRSGWFMSEQRPGSWIVESTAPNGQKQFHGADSESHAKKIANELRERGNLILDQYHKYERLGAYAGALPAEVADRFIRLEQSAWQTSLKHIREAHGDEVADALTGSFDPVRAVQKDILATGVGKITAKRYLVGGREDLDYVRVLQDYLVQLSSSVSRRDTRLRMELLLNDKQLETHDDLRIDIRKQLDAVLAPNSQEWHAAKSMLSSYFLGANLSSAMIEMTQSGVTLVPRLIEHGHGFVESYKMLGNAIPEAWRLTRTVDELNRHVEGAKRALKQGKKMSAEQERAVMFQKALDESILDWGHLEDMNLGKDANEIMADRLGHGLYDEMTPGKMSRNMAYNASQKFLFLYSRMANFNTKVAFLAGLDSGQRKGLSGEALYQHAQDVLHNSQFGGGRAGRPLYLAKLGTDSSRSALGLVHTLQQYSMAMTSMIAQLGRDAYGRNPHLKPHERKQAQKAFGTMMMTVTALGGALGIPGVGAALTLLEKIFGVEAHRAVREGLASLAGDDEEFGSKISDIALNGVANSMFGVDMASRTGINSIAGFSTFNGFNIVDLLGPAPSIVKNMVDATKAVAQEGDYMRAVKTLVPQTFKNSVDLATNYHKYGDLRFMDRGNNLVMKPNEWEALAYMIGFRPKKLRDWRTAQQLMKVSDELAGLNQASDLDQQARQLLRNPNPGVVIDYIVQRQQQDPLVNPNDLLRSIVDRAVAMTVQRDLLDSGLRANVGTRESIAGMFGDTIQRKSEVEVLQLKEQLLQRLGFPFGSQPATQRDRLKAMLLDQLTAQGMSRPRAITEVQKML